MKNNNISFDGKRPDEKVILLLHRHPITMAWSLTKSIVLFGLPIIAWLIEFRHYNLSSQIHAYIFVGILLWLTLAFLSLAYNWIDWQLDRFILTDVRVIDMDQHGLFHRQVHETSLEHVQEVYYEIKGILATLFNYGHVKVLTGGPSGDLIFENVADPKQVQRIILAEAGRFREEYAAAPASAEDLLKILLEHDQRRSRIPMQIK